MPGWIIIVIMCIYMEFSNALHLPYLICKLGSFDDGKNTGGKLAYREVKWLALDHTAYQ